MSETYDSSGRTLDPTTPTMPSPAPAVGGHASPALGQSSELSSGWIQLRPDGSGGAGGGAAGGAGGGAQGLDGLVGQVASDAPASLPHQSKMSAAFGRDFSGVEARTGPAARAACEQLGAEAFTHGNMVAFRSPNPSAETVAHELTHVVQQGGRPGVQTKLTVGEAGGSYEREAESTAKTVISGGQVDITTLSRAPAGIVSREPKTPLPAKFDKMWDAHPHNYQADGSQNTSSEKVQEDAGWDPNQYGNTCAIRLSAMWNKLGGEYKITPEKAVAAGLARNRAIYAKKQQWYYILSAKEMWTYVSHHFGKPHASWPEGTKRFKDADTFQKSFDSTIKPIVSGKKGIVAFDKIFGYSGTGHVDIFDGERLSDAASWYACQQLKVWYING
ncbi:MAG: T6SS effector amidase Tae4 family protein [Bradymonadia bacterium]